MGVTVLGSLAVVAGVVLLVLSLVNLLAFYEVIGIDIDPEVPGNLFLISVFLNLIVAIVLLGTGNGLLNLRLWAWWLAFLVALIGVVRSIFAFVTPVATAALSALLSSILGLLLLLVFLGYLVSVKKQFR